MAIRAEIGAMSQPLRWLTYPATWALLAATAGWFKSRPNERMSVSPVSADWLQDMQRQSTRARDL